MLPPALKPQSLRDYTRARNGKVSEQEWLDVNELFLSDLWIHFEKYVKACDPFVLDRCRYTDFCKFMAKHSTHYEN